MANEAYKQLPTHFCFDWNKQKSWNEFCTLNYFIIWKQIAFWKPVWLSKIRFHCNSFAKLHWKLLDKHGQKINLVIFIDLKAFQFDGQHYQQEKLELYGIKVNALLLLQSYLSE